MNYTDRVNNMARRPRDTENPDLDPFVTLIGLLAATLCNAADQGHVTPNVHRELETIIHNAETQMGMY